MNLLPLLGFLLIGAAPSPHKPIGPLTLRWLYVNADLVVVAKPGNTEGIEPSKDHGYSARVRLSIEKTFKGDAKGTGVTVFFGPTVSCPEPDRYPEGKTVLAFLSWDDHVKAYYSHGLSYGAKELPPEDLKVYLARIEELGKIPDGNQKDPQSAETLEWLVRCMEHPATRWEGAFEFDVLESGGKRRSENLSDRVPTTKLTAEHINRLIDVLLQTGELSKGDLELASVLTDVADPRIDRLLAKSVRRLIEARDSWQGEIVARVFALRHNSSKTSALMQSLHDLDRQQDNPARIRVLEEFLKLVGE